MDPYTTAGLQCHLVPTKMMEWIYELLYFLPIRKELTLLTSPPPPPDSLETGDGSASQPIFLFPLVNILLMWILLFL